MSHGILIHVYRKPGMSPQEFKSHYEDVHIPLVKSLTKSLFPASHRRRYIKRSSETTENYDAAILSGTQADFGYDAIAELTFDDEAALQSFFAQLQKSGAKEKLDVDCAKFMDMTKGHVVLMSDCIETRGGKS